MGARNRIIPGLVFSSNRNFFLYSFLFCVSEMIGFTCSNQLSPVEGSFFLVLGLLSDSSVLASRL